MVTIDHSGAHRRCQNGTRQMTEISDLPFSTGRFFRSALKRFRSPALRRTSNSSAQIRRFRSGLGGVPAEVPIASLPGGMALHSMPLLGQRVVLTHPGPRCPGPPGWQDSQGHCNLLTVQIASQSHATVDSKAGPCLTLPTTLKGVRLGAGLFLEKRSSFYQHQWPRTDPCRLLIFPIQNPSLWLAPLGRGYRNCRFAVYPGGPPAVFLRHVAAQLFGLTFIQA